MQPDIAALGGGLAGLVSAATAARGGANVTLIEARTHVGGRARTIVSDSGYVFNQGPHALYRSGAALPILRSLGIEPKGKQPPVRGWGRLRGRVDRLPAAPLDALRTRLIGVRAKAELGRSLARPAHLLSTETENRSLQQWIDEQFDVPDARLMAAMLARISTYCADLDRLDAQVGVSQMVAAFTEGVLYLDGGWAQLVDGLVRAANDAGVKIAEATKVTSLSRTAGRFLFDLDGATMAADRVILANGGPSHAAAVAGELSPALRDWAGSCEPVHASCLDLAMRALPRPDRRFGGGVEDPLYLSVHTPTARLAPSSGGEVVHVMRYGYSDHDPRPEIEAFLDDLQPGWRAHVVEERYGRRLVVAYDRPRPGVSRRGPALADCPGLFVAGDWVGSAGLLADAAVASGAEAARLALA